MGPPQSYTCGTQMCPSRPLLSLRSGGRHWRAARLYLELSFLPTDIPHHPRDSPVSTDRLQNRTPSKGKGGIVTVTAAPVAAGPAPAGWVVMSNPPDDVLRCQPLCKAIRSLVLKGARHARREAPQLPRSPPLLVSVQTQANSFPNNTVRYHLRSRACSLPSGCRESQPSVVMDS